MAIPFVPISILAHIVLSLMLLPAIGLYVTGMILRIYQDIRHPEFEDDDVGLAVRWDVKWGFTWLGPWIIIILWWCLRDYLIFRRRIPPKIDYWQEAFIMSGFFVTNSIYLSGSGVSDSSLPLLGISLYGLFLIMTILLSGFMVVLPVAVFLERKIQVEERAYTLKQTRDFLHRNTVFRKHPFEPTFWALARGAAAIYCGVGLFLYVYFVWGTLPSRESISIQETVQPSTQISLSELQKIALISDRYVSNGAVESLTAWDHDPYFDRLNQSKFTMNSSMRTFQLEWSIFPEEMNLEMNYTVSYQNTTTLWWIVLTSRTDDPATVLAGSMWEYATPISTPPGTQVDVLCKWTWYKFGTKQWVACAPEVMFKRITVPASNSSLVTVTSQNAYAGFPQVTLVSQSIVPQLLSSLGGAYAFIEGIFALVFGRSLLSVLTGSRPISPFGILGMFARTQLENMIHKEYPGLKAETERNGLAAYAREVAIDVAFPKETRSDDDLRRRRTVSDHEALEEGVCDGHSVGEDEIMLANRGSDDRDHNVLKMSDDESLLAERVGKAVHNLSGS